MCSSFPASRTLAPVGQCQETHVSCESIWGIWIKNTDLPDPGAVNHAVLQKAVVHSAHVAQGCDIKAVRGAFVSLRIPPFFEQPNPLQMILCIYISPRRKNKSRMWFMRYQVVTQPWYYFWVFCKVRKYLGDYQVSSQWCCGWVRLFTASLLRTRVPAVHQLSASWRGADVNVVVAAPGAPGCSWTWIAWPSSWRRWVITAFRCEAWQTPDGSWITNSIAELTALIP